MSGHMRSCPHMDEGGSRPIKVVGVDGFSYTFCHLCWEVITAAVLKQVMGANR